MAILHSLAHFSKRMLQPNVLPLITFIFCSWRTLNGVVISDPQTNLLYKECTPNNIVISNISILNANVNEMFQDVKEQITTPNKHFVTAIQPKDETPVYTLFQCRNYLSIPDCVACFNAASRQIRKCPDEARGARIVYDGCFLRYETSPFFDRTETPSTAVAWCGNQSIGGATAFTSVIQQVLKNLQKATPKIKGYFAATKMQLPNNSATIYASAQCIQTISQSECEGCLNAGYNDILICLPYSDGKAYANQCFIRYSTTSFFPDNQTIVSPLVKQAGLHKKGDIVFIVVGGVAFVLILLTLFAWIRRPKVPRGDITKTSKLKGPVTFSYKELEFATKNFSVENKLGEGGFGAVYKGTLKNGKVVAVKKLTLRSKRLEEEFQSEVKLISNIHHRNLIRLIGCCSEGNERILVYEYMKNTSLDRFLFGQNKGSLDWKQRYHTILGIARGLAYLHEELHIRIIHRDIKTNNILLDDDLQPRIADFGLARLLPEEKSHLSTKFAGTLGYTAPEYVLHGQLSEKVDIYSFGVVILEIISGQRSNELKVNGDAEGGFLLQKAWKLYERGIHLELVDDTLDPVDYDAEEVEKIIEIGLRCTQAVAKLRPTMFEIIVLLQSKGLSDNMRPTMPFFIEG